jgi:hypothetical protein
MNESATTTEGHLLRVPFPRSWTFHGIPKEVEEQGRERMREAGKRLREKIEERILAAIRGGEE